MLLHRRISQSGRWEHLEEACIRIVTAGGMSAMGFYRDAAVCLRQPADAGGDPILDGLLRSYSTQGKNPPTRADLEATATIIRMADSLLQPIASELLCGFSMLGEETVQADYRRWVEHVLGRQIANKVHEPAQFFAAEQNVLRVILDGLDGTANFSRGLPLFCTAVAVLVDDQPRVAALYDPIHNVVYSGILPGPHDDPARGGTASAWEVAAGNRLDLVEQAKAQEERARISQEAIGIHLTRTSDEKLREFLSSLETLALGSGAVYALNAGIPAMAYVARGSLGAFLNNYTNPWDVAAGEVLVKACGGIVTDYDGKDIKYDSFKRVSVVAAKAHLHSRLLEMVGVKGGQVSSTLLDMVTRFYEGIFTESAEERVPRILSEAARVFEADIATWFLVTEDRTQLRLVDVYNDMGTPTTRPPAMPYILNWDAKSEAEVVGLTAWTAISGQSLHIPSVESLTKEHGKSHAGRWDDWLYPQGITDPKSGFLCMYAVPLYSPNRGEPRENVIGVLKMERRNMKDEKKRRPFTKTDLDAFNIIARIMGFAYSHSERQKSLTLLDIGHTLIRPLGDVAIDLEIISLALSRSDMDKEHARSKVEAATTTLRSLSSMLRLAKESYNQPLQYQEVDVREDLGRHMAAYSLTSGRKVIDRSNGALGPISLTRRSYAALVNIAINLIDNATRNAPLLSEVSVGVERSQVAIELTVENRGEEIKEEIIEVAQPQHDRPLLFQGLPRSYQLAARNGWTLKYSHADGINRFVLHVPHPFDDGASIDGKRKDGTDRR